jgi:poly-gamma-glutamate synthesis protein (capsule biosynthesis protein)
MHQPILDSCLQEDGTYDFHPVFSHIRPYLESADCSVANLETTLCGPGRPYSGYPRFNSPDSLVDALRDAGLDLLLTANNHSFDTEADGFFHTIRVIREAGLDNLGTRLRADEPDYRVVSVHGIRIGMACFTD